ncbi:STM4013/SEN3800 family hydrolase [Rubellicoccus peritrichatus]|uniref:STM4013/SEN3800 family hydrolase n=1 Tax=Rubellicoccus peritrichatus TaxID=3080537 RepID=A0AAQ3L7H6_9BACT|nr:STM4013/SEN3800 family hydrolase [Puniceicoccus sp. CR14]WOO39352.1 STM4013/SEN3800 family hydrolase [Puniceicoccus sp. CR14]
MKEKVGSHDILFITLDSLRYDVAVDCWQKGLTPHFQALLGSVWEKRHTPGNFTYAAHHAFFAGFLPTPADPKADKMRLMATEFAGSETIGPQTQLFQTSNIVEGFRDYDYRTLCIGGVGFFNKKTALSSVLTDCFDESHWSDDLGVICPDSAMNQFRLASERIKGIGQDERYFLFMNMSAIHQPNYFYKAGSTEDTIDSHAAALQSVDQGLPILLKAMRQRERPVFYIICSDHGTAYGEDGFYGHRLSHDTVWTVPYADGILE